MASNISQVGDAIGNLNVTFEDVSVDGILQTAIESTNASSNGWVGLFVFIVMCASVTLFIYANRNGFNIFDKFGFIFVSMSVWLDFGMYLIIWGIVESLQIYIQIYTLFFVLAFFSLLKKELLSTEN